MRTLFLLLRKPLSALHRIKSKPKWIVPFLLLSALSITIYISKHPLLVQATAASLPSTATSTERELVVQRMQEELPLRCLFLPIRVLIGWATFAMVLYFITRALRPPGTIHFRKVIALEVHAESINCLAGVASLLRTLINSGSMPKSVSHAPFSIASVFPTDDFVLFALLNSMNLFTLWYIVVLILGIAIQSGASRGQSAFAVLSTWTFSLMFNCGALKLMHDTMHLLL